MTFEEMLDRIWDVIHEAESGPEVAKVMRAEIRAWMQDLLVKQRIACAEESHCDICQGPCEGVLGTKLVEF